MAGGATPGRGRAHGEPGSGGAALIRRHRAIGWWSLLVFLSLGLLLEYFHGFKTGWYLDVDNETRRLLLRLAHTHGAVFALVHLAFCEGLYRSTVPVAGWGRMASTCLIAATVCMPGGFLLGGLFLHGGDPGLGVVLVPVGGLFLLAGIFLIARALTREPR